MAQITYDDKVALNENPSVAEINKVTDDNMNEIKNTINTNTPVGVITAYAGDTAPNGWLLCDGSAVSRTTYANLFSVIGTKCGAGDGSTTFNLPNIKGRSLVGVDPDDTDFNVVGATGGEKTHTLTESELPKLSGEGQFKPYDNFSTSGIVQGKSWSQTKGFGAASGTQTGAVYGFQINFGGDQAHNNLSPYAAVNFIISY